MFTTRVDRTLVSAPLVPARVVLLLLAGVCLLSMPGCLLVAAGAAGAGAGYVVANEKTRDSSKSDDAKSD